MPNTQLDLIRRLTSRVSPKVPSHIHAGSKGGKVPGIRRENRKYPDGKPKVRAYTPDEGADSAPAA